MDNEDLVVYLLRDLDGRHRTARQLLEERTTVPTFASAQSTLQLDEDRLGGPQAATEQPTSTVFYTNGSHGGQGSYGGGGHGLPSPAHGKQKRKRTDKHTGYTPIANAAPRPPLTGVVPVYAPPQAVGGPGILGPRPYAFSSFAPVQYGTLTPIGPASTFGAPSPFAAPSPYTMSAPPFMQHMQHLPQQFVPPPAPSPPQQQMPIHDHNSVKQAGLMQALHNLSINNGSNNGWVADSGATSHMATAHACHDRLFTGFSAAAACHGRLFPSFSTTAADRHPFRLRITNAAPYSCLCLHPTILRSFHAITGHSLS
ncbi:hypothetical protein QYE76_036269 [Lolium multiflorum]|uniref:Uncharacterized protein n=1 Tax=Lolium multiflorum TaxID=4521 RepID=A0AAD8R2B7_LOLMU|nr:hypothetical protein QYE76_036269 [Lolium multiflorum]